MRAGRAKGGGSKGGKGEATGGGGGKEAKGEGKKWRGPLHLPSALRGLAGRGGEPSRRSRLETSEADGDDVRDNATHKRDDLNERFGEGAGLAVRS